LRSITGRWASKNGGLIKDLYHQLEFDTTMHFLRKALPRKGLVLDAGGGPGRCTIELGKLGYGIVLLDFVPEMLQIADRQIKKAGVQERVRQTVLGSLDDLKMFDDCTFDAVISLGGPLCHILERNRREKAIDELIRVAKRNAPICVSVIGKLAVLVNELVRNPEEMEIEEVFNRIRDTGDYYGGYGFAPCHFYMPDELKESFETRGIRVLEMVGLEGLSTGHSKETNRLFRRYRNASQIWWQTHLKTCNEPSAVGISEHFLAICKKET
jgi:ubiquinone/menaquinone biosynthesis C-methylase UbiE